MKISFSSSSSFSSSNKLFNSRTRTRRITIWFACVLAVFSAGFFSSGARAETTNDLSDAEIQGRKLARQLYETWPNENITNTGVIQIRDSKDKRTAIPFVMAVRLQDRTIGYQVLLTNHFEVFAIVHTTAPDSYPITWLCYYSTNKLQPGESPEYHGVGEGGLQSSFAGSDFWLADLALEFFHWPQQKVLKHEMRRSRACTVLESTNPNPSTNGYSRVVSWIDNESGGIVQAEAYDAKNKLLKEFAPKSFTKVNGQWQLQEMEIRNVQTGSRTRLEFDLKKD